jgi:nucleoside-diphosphate-sugar epimerase
MRKRHVTALNATADLKVSQTFRVLAGDITDPAAVKRAVDGCDVVVHCAALQSGRAKLDEFRRVNVDGTLNLLRAARDAKVSRYIHISTINVHVIPRPKTQTPTRRYHSMAISIRLAKRKPSARSGSSREVTNHQ